jgi:DNA-binding transcriptional LysR family regulator
MLAEAEAAQDAIDSAQAEPRGRLRITCPVSLMQSYMADILSRFLARYPHVSIDVETTNRRVDVIEEGIDIAFRVRFPPLENSDLVLKRLAPSRQIIVAAPDLINVVGTPGEPEGLVSFPSLALSRNTPKHTWNLRHVDGRECAVAFEPRYVTDDMAALRLAAERGKATASHLDSTLSVSCCDAATCLELRVERTPPPAVSIRCFWAKADLFI